LFFIPSLITFAAQMHFNLSSLKKQLLSYTILVVLALSYTFSNFSGPNHLHQISSEATTQITSANFNPLEQALANSNPVVPAPSVIILNGWSVSPGQIKKYFSGDFNSSIISSIKLIWVKWLFSSEVKLLPLQRLLSICVLRI
jgi:hypothetical protein